MHTELSFHWWHKLLARSYGLLFISFPAGNKERAKAKVITTFDIKTWPLQDNLRHILRVWHNSIKQRCLLHDILKDKQHNLYVSYFSNFHGHINFRMNIWRHDWLDSSRVPINEDQEPVLTEYGSFLCLFEFSLIQSIFWPKSEHEALILLPEHQRLWIYLKYVHVCECLWNGDRLISY